METLELSKDAKKENLSVFNFSNYKKYLEARLKDSWGLVTKVAEAAGCQRAYLSRVLNDDVHITPDHAYGITNYFEMSPSEAEYFLALVEYARAGSRNYREFMERKIKYFRREHENLAKRLGREKIEAIEVQAQYYSAWHWSAIHVLVSIPHLQFPDEIAKKLNLPLGVVHVALQELAKSGFVRFERGRWVHASGNISLAKNSPFITYHHNNWRTRAVQDAQNRHNESIHYTNVQAMSFEAVKEIKEFVMDFVDASNKVAGSSNGEEVYCTNLDFFSV
jgi:uncharacterized protein (TIGR02147 family)